MRRVLFLDFDGVISSTENWFERRARRAHQLGLPTNRVEAAALLAPPEVHQIYIDASFEEAKVYVSKDKPLPPDWRDCVRGNVLGDWYSLDPEAVARLERLVRQAECDVVISSQWRRWSPQRHMVEELRASGLVSADRIIDQTPDFKYDDENRPRRADEIRAWLEAQRDTINFVVLDDRCDIVQGLWDRLVNVHHVEGLQDEDVEKALTLFQRR